MPRPCGLPGLHLLPPSSRPSSTPPAPVRSLLLIAAGGAIGALMRHFVSVLVYRLVPSTFPWGTLAANLVGCFFIGALWTLSERASFPPGLALFLFTGMLGAFTTFSTYALESLQLMQRGQVWSGLANIAVSTVAGLLLVLAGMALTRSLLRAVTA